VSASHKAIEIILINRFGKKNIPQGNFWRLADTSKEVYGAQKYLWPVIRRLCKTYKDTAVLLMVQKKGLKYLSMKDIPKYLYWCKEEKDLQQRIEQRKPHYNKIELEEKPLIDIEKKENNSLLDWLES
jgi:hypothetical protein